MMPELKVRSAKVVAATGDDLATAVAVRHSTPHHVAFASTSGVFDRSARGVVLSRPMQDPAVVERSCSDAQALSVLVPSTTTSVPVDSVAPWMRPTDLASAPWSSARRYIKPESAPGGLATTSAASRAQVDATGRLGAATVRWPQLRSSEMLLPAERDFCGRLFERGESPDITRAAAVTALHHHPLLPFFASAGVAGQALLWRLGRANGVCRFDQAAAGVAETGVYAGHRLSCVQWSPQGDRLASADSLGGVWVWDSERPEKALAAFRGHTRKSSGIAFLDAGNVFAVSGSSDASALGSEATSYGGPTALRHADIPAVPPLPRGSLPSVRVFDMRANQRARCVATVSATIGSASAIACAPGDRALIVGGSRGDIGLFDLRAMCLVHHHSPGKDCHTRGIRALTVDPSGSFAASGGGDGTVRIWGVPSLEDIGCLPGLFAERTFVGHKLGDGMVSRAGVTGLVLTEDSLFASGTGGFVYALPKKWV